MAIHVRNLFARCLGAPSCINLNGLLSNIRSFQLVQEIQGPSDDLLELFGLCRLVPFLLATTQAACWCGWRSGLCLSDKVAHGHTVKILRLKRLYVLIWLSF